MQDSFYSAYAAVLQTDFDTARMVVSSQELSNCALDLSTCTLIGFENDGDKRAWSEKAVLGHRHAEMVTWSKLRGQILRRLQ